MKYWPHLVHFTVIGFKVIAVNSLKDSSYYSHGTYETTCVKWSCEATKRQHLGHLVIIISECRPNKEVFQ